MKASAALGIPGILTQRTVKLAMHNGKSVLSIADCFLVLHILRYGCQEDMVHDLPRESFHCVLFSLYFTLTHAALVYPLQYLR